MLFKELNYLYYFVRLGIVGLHHYLADVVSDKYQNNDKTTTRDIPHNIDNKIIIDANKKFYAISQIAATSTLLITSNPDNGFVIMFPIQFSTFLMTLVRKGFISNNQWHIFYSLSLALPYIINYNMISVNNNKLYINIFHVILRLMLRTNKFFNFAMVTILYKFVKFSF